MPLLESYWNLTMMTRATFTDWREDVKVSKRKPEKLIPPQTNQK